MKKLAIFVSGGGSNLRAIQHEIESGNINAQVTLVVTNNFTCGGANYARKLGIRVSKAENLLEELIGCDLIVLAGYLKLIPSEIVRDYTIVNIHPALLPKYGGKGFHGQKVHESVLSAGEKESGVTVHYVDEKYDHGEIIGQVRVSVLENDTSETLAARVLKQEHKIYPKIIGELCKNM